MAARYVASAGAVAAVALVWFAIPAALTLVAVRHFRRRAPVPGG